MKITNAHIEMTFAILFAVVGISMLIEAQPISYWTGGILCFIIAVDSLKGYFREKKNND